MWSILIHSLDITLQMLFLIMRISIDNVEHYLFKGIFYCKSLICVPWAWSSHSSVHIVQHNSSGIQTICQNECYWITSYFKNCFLACLTAGPIMTKFCTHVDRSGNGYNLKQISPSTNRESILEVLGGKTKSGKASKLLDRSRNLAFFEHACINNGVIFLRHAFSAWSRGKEEGGATGCNTFESPFATVSKIGHFRSLHWRPGWLSCINEYLAIDSGGHVSDLALARNCCLTRMLPGEAELVSEWTGLPGRQKVWSALSGYCAI